MAFEIELSYANAHEPHVEWIWERQNKSNTDFDFQTFLADRLREAKSVMFWYCMCTSIEFIG